MRWLTLLVAVVLAVSSCGGGRADDGVSPSSAGAMPTSSSTISTTSSSTTTSTTATTSTTTSAPSTTTAHFEMPAILRSDGIATVDFGTGAEEAMAVLTELLGPPSEVRDEGAHEFYWSVEHVRFVTWDDLGLQLVFTDWNGDFTQPVAIPLHLADWDVGGPGLTTVEGLGWGTTVGELRAMYPDLQFGINEFAPMFTVEEAGGGIIGSFTDWPYEDFARAVIAALNEHGAGLDPDDLDAATGQALIDFMESRGVDGSNVLTALGLPPDGVRTGWMHAGAGPLCC